MTPFWRQRFTRQSAAHVRERRRLRWSEVYSRLFFGLGVLFGFLQQKDIIILFPDSWRPYIAGASAFAALVAGSEYLERRHDFKRYQAKLARDAEQRLSQSDKGIRQ